jgi:hypothetical protein
MRALPLCRGHLTPRNVPILLCVQCERRWPPKPGEAVLPRVPFVADGQGGRCDQRVPPLLDQAQADLAAGEPASPRRIWSVEDPLGLCATPHDVSADATASALPLVPCGAGGAFFN